eukprot:TRINITY_DN6304_c0_g1_i1.p1 TRINITY_DN6304_c0_g1~~TRINITY_DN6304_c0_g1_i1.p1  ORF type:complete len:109 (-),score=28.11 TRINITY_DN6304_c0_g1_i1:34-360(-)
MSGRGGKGGKGGAKGGANFRQNKSGPAPDGKGKAHGLKPRQRRDAKQEGSSDFEKKIARLRDELGGLVEMASDAQLEKLLEMVKGDLEEAKQYILTNGVPEQDEDSDE